MKTIVIQPRSFWSRRDLTEMVEFRLVFFILIWRDIKLRYRQTYVGGAWVVLQPLATSLLFAVVFGKWMKAPSDGVPYLPFAFCGLIPWLVFSQSVQRASFSLLNEMNLMQKVYFPRIFLPVAGTLGVAIDYIIAITTFLILMHFYELTFHLQMLFLPVCTLLIFAFSSAFNILLSCLSVHYRDFKHIIPFFLQFWMYASPLAYSTSVIPEKWKWLYCLNPLTGLIDVFRWTLLGLPNFPYFSFVISFSSTVILLFLSLFLFRKLEHTFADVI